MKREYNGVGTNWNQAFCPIVRGYLLLEVIDFHFTIEYTGIMGHYPNFFGVFQKKIFVTPHPQ